MDGEAQQFGNIILGGKNQHREENLGILRMHTGGFGWKSKKSGQVIAISKSDLKQVEWLKIPHAYQLKLRIKGGFVYMFNGLKNQDKDTIREYAKASFDKEMEEGRICYKGWNWGEASIEATTLTFRIGAESAFEVPLNDVTQANAQKSDAVVEMADDDTALPEDEMLVELRLHVAATGDDGGVDEAGAESFVAAIKESGDLEAAGSTLCDFPDVPIQVPRGRYDIELFDKYMKLHGKTFDYKCLYTNVSSLYLLPKQDGYHMALIVSLEHPLRQGATTYPHLVLQLPKEAPCEVSLNLEADELQRRFGDKLELQESGDMPDVFAKVFSAFTKKKVQQIKASGFNGSSFDDKTKSIRCSMKAIEGFLYPLDKCFFFIANKPVLIHYDKISNIEFNRVNAQDKNARTFDITVHFKDGSAAQQFVNLARSDYKELFRFLGATKIRIKNINSATNAAEGDDDDDDAGGEDDPYLQRVKRQRQQQQQGGDDDDDDDDDESEGEDADFAPGGESDVDEEYDEGSEDDGERAAPKKKAKKDKEAKKEEDGEDGEGGGGGGGGDGGGGGGGGDSSSDEDAPLKSPKKKAKKEKEAKKEDGKKKKKKKKDKDEPKRALSAYMYFMQKNRELIKSDYLAKHGEEIKFTEIAKDAGARWKEMSADDKKEYDEMAATDKQRYIDDMKAYKEKKRAEAAGDDASEEEEEAPASAGGAAADNASDDE